MIVYYNIGILINFRARKKVGMGNIEDYWGNLSKDY